ncbi:MAG: M48 family metalloprotease [Caulobacterales bacterium]|jgi:predicted Zn-dependent protease
MAAPARPVFRLALAATLALSLVLRPGLAAAQFAAGDSLIRDTEIEDILHRDAAPLFTAAGIDPKGVKIVLVGSKEPNASAGPGVMMVTTALILQTKNPNELQGVMAHEVGHLAGGHSFRSGDMQRAGMVPMILTMGLGVLAAIAGSGEGAAGLISSAPYFGALGVAGYSREQESRADQAGASLLEKAGLSARGLAEFLDNNVYQEVFAQYRRYKYFIDHPLSSDRVEALQNRVVGLPHYNAKDPPEALAEHEIMKAKLDGFINPQVSMTKYDEKDTSYPARYARAIAYYQMKEPDKALARVDALLAEQPNNPYLYELKGQILFEFGRVEQAEAPQRKSVELKPDGPLLRVNLGQTLIALNKRAKTEEGIAELKKALTQENDNATAWRILAEAYDKHGDEGLARLATAEFEYNIGDLGQARAFAIRARERLPKDGADWRRATDIVLVSKPSRDDLKEMGKQGLRAAP